MLFTAQLKTKFESEIFIFPVNTRRPHVPLDLKMPYKVISLNRENIYDWSAVNTVMRGNAFAGIITKHSIIYSRDDARDVAVSFSNEIGGVSEAVVYKKRGRNVNFSNMELTHAYTAPLGVDKNKKEDLLKLCAFLPNDCKPFYESLAVRN